MAGFQSFLTGVHEIQKNRAVKNEITFIDIIINQINFFIQGFTNLSSIIAKPVLLKLATIILDVTIVSSSRCRVNTFSLLMS